MNYFDLHCDTAKRCFVENLDFNSNLLAVNSNCGKHFDKWKQCFAVFIKDGCKKPFSAYQNILCNFKNKVCTAPDIIPIYTIEGGAPIEKDVSRIYRFYKDGIKVLSLTWNGENALAGGADSNADLKPLGKAIIKELNRYGMVCDLSHLNRKSFFTAAKCADKVMASHSCFDYINSHKRNLTDEQLLFIREKGGIVGICFYPVFLGEGDVFENFYRHISHALDLGLENNISIGSDFDGADMSEKLSSPYNIPTLKKYLFEKGIENTVLDKLFYQNADNFFKCL